MLPAGAKLFADCKQRKRNLSLAPRFAVSKDTPMNQRYLEQLALDLGAHPNAMEAWRYRGFVPHRWRLPLLQAAAARGVLLPLSLFESLEPIREDTPRAGRKSRAKGGPVVSSAR